MDNQNNRQGERDWKSWVIAFLGAVIVVLMTLGISDHLSVNRTTAEDTSSNTADIKELKTNMRNFQQTLEQVNAQLNILIELQSSSKKDKG